MPKIRVVVADDHGLMREGVKALLRVTDDIEVVGEAEDGEEAIREVRRLDPDVVLMDVAMPGLGGLEATLAIRKEKPAVKVLVLTQYDDREYVARFLKAGVAGYVLKRAAASELTAAIRAAHRGGLVLDPEIAREAWGDAHGTDRAEGDPYDALTDREKQVLKLVAEGRSNKDIAETLDISVKTAMAHREHLMEKLDVHNRTELIRFALKRGVIRV
ncbi:MAG TPA: response regulator transcription factor [Candidatus Polarisedimenticolaceae bacterium]|nr:response regulator transcription factor [Candidatus Polarisedimenticolaceae bacterium]